MPAAGEHLTTNCFINQAFFNSVDESSLNGNNKNNKFNSHFSSNLSHTTSKQGPTGDNDAVIKRYVDSLSENDRERRDMSITFNDQDNEFDNIKLTKLDSITDDRDPLSDEEL